MTLFSKDVTYIVKSGFCVYYSERFKSLRNFKRLEKYKYWIEEFQAEIVLYVNFEVM